MYPGATGDTWYDGIDTDCDDTDDEVNSAADEVCDSYDTDEDCDGYADDDDGDVTGQTTYYLDADGDGYGAGSGVASCEATSEWVTNDADCDDGDAAVSPASGDCTIDLGTADAKLVGENAGDSAGNSVSGAGDVDADGWADLLVGAYGEDDGGSDAGAAYLLLGSGL